MKIFVTGGAGFIGSHTCVELLINKHEVLVFDNLSNGSEIALKRVEIITQKTLQFVNGDIRDSNTLINIMKNFKPDAVLHFAGLKAVNESVADPIKYYDINVRGTVELLAAMKLSDCFKIIFSSSATVYGNASYLPFDELHRLNPTNPYGRTKLMIEKILEDWVYSSYQNHAVCLRYFNPIGAHISGFIGEDPANTPNNLMPYISQVVAGQRAYLSIFGDDYPTRDGTGERDYIHVCDLALGHLRAVEKISALDRFQVLNLGTGIGTTVQELVDVFQMVSGRTIPIKIAPRRPGDVAQSWADPSSANALLDIKFVKTIQEMCADTWRWQNKNPNGYKH